MRTCRILRTLVIVVVLVVRGAAASAPVAGFHMSPRASVLVSGGAMMNGVHFADSVLPVMREHYAGCRRVVLVLHASHPTERDAMEERLRAAFVHLLGSGVTVESPHRRDAAGAKELLSGADGLFAGGGETFVLLGELQRTGQLDLIRARVLAGVPYGGSSAGANVAGLCIGTTNDFPTADVVSLAALGVFPAVINPHHPAPVPATKADYEARAGKLATYLKFNPDQTVLALGNAAVARLHGGHVKLVAGRGWIYRGTGAGGRELVVGEVVPGLGPSGGQR
jgi:dipeptidase E